VSLLSKLKKLFKRKSEPEVLEEKFKLKEEESAPQRSEALRSASERFESEVLEEKPKEAFSIGFAAGYAGKSLLTIEEKVRGLEEKIITKEWAQSEVVKRLDDILFALQKHDESTKKIHEKIAYHLIRILEVAQNLAQPHREAIEKEVEEIRKEISLTPRMQKVLELIREKKEISYKELARNLGYSSISGIRALLSEISKRTDEIERFVKNGEGWVRIKGASERSEALRSAS